jgi:hypothetical protein
VSLVGLSVPGNVTGISLTLERFWNDSSTGKMQLGSDRNGRKNDGFFLNL